MASEGVSGMERTSDAVIGERSGPGRWTGKCNESQNKISGGGAMSAGNKGGKERERTLSA